MHRCIISQGQIMDNWDAVIIGSGAGGLTTAVALANAGKKVLLLEQHYLPGGWTHSFSLNGYRFSPGVHYLGQLGEDGSMRRVLAGLGVGGELEFCELGTPLANDHYLNSHRGNLYRTAKTRFQVGPFAFPVKTEIAGLYHCGASTVSHGVMGVLMSGISAARAILGCRTRDLLTHEAQGRITLLPPSSTIRVLPTREGDHEMSHV